MVTKLVFAILASVLAVTAAQENTCDSESIKSLLAEDAAVKCAAETGFSLLSAQPPSICLAARICLVDACLDAVEMVDEMYLNDCLLPTGLHLNSELLAPIWTICYEPTTDNGESIEESGCSNEDDGEVYMLRREPGRVRRTARRTRRL